MKLFNRYAMFLNVIFATCFFAVPSPGQAEWILEQDVPTIDKLRGVGGVSAEQVLAVGDYGTMLFFDGTSWSAVETITDKTIYDVCWVSDTEAFAVADKGRIIHYNGIGWTMEVVSDMRLRGIWGTSPSNVYAVGNDGTMLHYNGSAWDKVIMPTDVTLQSVWGFSETDIYAVGGPSETGGTGFGSLIHFDGNSWSTLNENVYPRFKDVWGAAQDTIFVIGDEGALLRYDATTEELDLEPLVTPESLKGIWGSSGDNVYVVGDHGTILYYDGVQWLDVSSGTSEDLFAVWGITVGSVFAVGDRGTILRYSEETTPDDNETETCPFELALESSEDLALLRSFRDCCLTSITDFDLTGLFYRHINEVSALFRFDPLLKISLNSLVVQNRQVIQNLLREGRACVSSTAFNDILLFLDNLNQKGSLELKTTLTMVKQGLTSEWLLELTGISVE